MDSQEPVATEPAGTCQWSGCGGPMKPASRRNLHKRFCSDRCRVADRDDRVRAAILTVTQAVEDTRAVLDQAQADLDRMGARLTGARQLLEQITPKPRRRPQAGGIVLTQAQAGIPLGQWLAEQAEGARQLQGGHLITADGAVPVAVGEKLFVRVDHLGLHKVDCTCPDGTGPDVQVNPDCLIHGSSRNEK